MTRPLRFRRLLLVPALAGILAASACGQLPRPFQPEHKDLGPLFAAAVRGIQVEPLTRDAPGRAEAAAEVLAAALREHGLAASTAGPEDSYRLVGRAVLQPQTARVDEVLLYWELQTAGGGRVGVHAQRSELPQGLWQAGDRDAVAAVMNRAAQAIAALVQGPPSEAAAVPDKPRTRIVILPMDFLPGDGRITLPRALAAELMAAGVPIGAEIAEQDLLLQGDLELGAARDGLQEVSLTWTLIRAEDDSDLGRIDQQNRVPAGSLDGPWGAMAGGMARGAAEGIVELIGRLGDRRS